MNYTYIYALVDPCTQQCRYIGKADNPALRLQRHMQPNRLKDQTHKTAWLRKLRAEGFYPELVEIEKVCKAEWCDAERFWVSYFSWLGANLTNGTKGGDGGSFPGTSNPMFGRKGDAHPAFGKHRPQDVKDRIRLAQLGKPKVLSPEALAKLQRLGQGQVGDKNPFFGRTHSEETKKLWSAKRKGTNPPNTRTFTIDGDSKTLPEWSALSGISYGTIQQRLRVGWDVKTAVFTPLTKQKGVVKKRVWAQKKKNSQK